MFIILAEVYNEVKMSVVKWLESTNEKCYHECAMNIVGRKKGIYFINCLLVRWDFSFCFSDLSCGCTFFSDSSSTLPVILRGRMARSFSRSCFLPLPTKAFSRTSLRVSTGMISTICLYLSSMRTSPRLALGMRTHLMPASAAASIFAVTPPIGSTVPRMLMDPVIATSCRTLTFSMAEMTAVISEQLAESPSTPS